MTYRTGVARLRTAWEMLRLTYSWGMILLLQEATTASAAQGAASTAGLGIGLSELLSGAVGALSIFLLGVVREMWRQRRERIALMTLVHLEVMHNKRILDRIQEGRGTTVRGMLKQRVYVKTPGSKTEVA